MKLRRGGSRHRPQPARTRQACRTLASRVPFFAIVAYGFVGTYVWLYGSLPVMVEHLGMMLVVFCLVGFESLTLLATVLWVSEAVTSYWQRRVVPTVSPVRLLCLCFIRTRTYV